MEIEDIEQIILSDVAKKVIDTLPDKEKTKILEMSLTATLKDVMKPWNIEKVIEKDVNRYMEEYLKRTEVQERIKISVEKSVDELIDGVIRVIIEKSQDGIKSNYTKFMKKDI